MRFLIVTLFLALGPTFASAQDPSSQPVDVAKSAPSTKLEAFSAKTGTVLVNGFSTLGVVNGLGKVSIDAREFRDASNPEASPVWRGDRG